MVELLCLEFYYRHKWQHEQKKLFNRLSKPLLSRNIFLNCTMLIFFLSINYLKAIEFELAPLYELISV